MPRVIDFHIHHVPARFPLTTVDNAPPSQKARWAARELLDAVRRILRVKFRAGLFEHPYADEAKTEETMAEPTSAPSSTALERSAPAKSASFRSEPDMSQPARLASHSTA